MSLTLPDELDTVPVRQFLERVAVELAESGEPINPETVERAIRSRLESERELLEDPVLRRKLSDFFFKKLGGGA